MAIRILDIPPMRYRSFHRGSAMLPVFAEIIGSRDIRFSFRTQHRNVTNGKMENENRDFQNEWVK
jgi:hypothetical protein